MPKVVYESYIIYYIGLSFDRRPWVGSTSEPKGLLWSFAFAYSTEANAHPEINACAKFQLSGMNKLCAIWIPRH